MSFSLSLDGFLYGYLLTFGVGLTSGFSSSSEDEITTFLFFKNEGLSSSEEFSFSAYFVDESFLTCFLLESFDYLPVLLLVALSSLSSEELFFFFMKLFTFAINSS